VDHLVLPSDDGRQDFLLFALRHIQIVQRAANLSSDLVELLGRNVEILMGFVQLLAGVLKGPSACWQRLPTGLTRSIP
jgi:hypothetical protein